MKAVIQPRKFTFPKNSKLCKIFNNNTIKMSYGCLPNMKNIINSHNRKILKVNNLSNSDCNCRNNTKCPFSRYCFEKGIYTATIYWSKGDKVYKRSTGVSFKSRFNLHNYSLNSDKGIQTKLSQFHKANRNGIHINFFTKFTQN